MSGTEINCVLLIIPPGYEHREKYARNPRMLNNPMRVLTGERYVLPVAVGNIEVSEKNKKKGLSGGPAIVGLSFGPPRAEGQKKSTLGGFEAIRRLVAFAHAPYEAEQNKEIYWCTIRADATEVEKIRGLVVVVTKETAEILMRWLQEHVTRGFPSNFVPTDDLLSYLFSSNPGDLLKAIGIEFSNGSEDQPPEESNEDENVEGWENEDSELLDDEEDWWGDEDEGDDERIGFEDDEEEEEKDYREDREKEGDEEEEQEEEEEDEEEEREIRESIRREERESEPLFPFRDSGKTVSRDQPSGPPSQVSSQPASPPVAKGELSEAAQKLLQTMKSHYRPSNFYPRPKEEQPEPGEFDFVKPYLPTPEAALISMLIALFSLLIRPLAITIVVLYGGRSGLRILLGALLLSLPYIAIVLHLPATYYVYVPASLGVLSGFMMMSLGIKSLYERYKLKFELSSVSKKAIGQIKSISQKKSAVSADGAAGMSAMGQSVSMQEATGSITDITLLLSLILFAVPPLYPVASALFMASLNAERKKPIISAINLLGIAAFAALVLGKDKLTPGWMIVSLIAFSLSYLSPNSPHDINKEKIKNIPQSVREWTKLLLADPKQALTILWSGKAKPKEEKVEFVLPPVPLPARKLITEDLARNIVSGGLLARQHIEALEMAAASGDGKLLPLPLRFEIVSGRKFYHLGMKVSVVQPKSGLPIAPEATNEMQKMVLSRAMSAGFTIGDGNVLETPAMCPINPTIPPSGCQLAPAYEEPIVSGNNVIVPIGRSFMYYLDQEGNHVHYTSGILLSPNYAGHLTIGAASGSGKSVMVRAIVNGIARASRKYPIKLLYIEGKQESSSPQKYGDYLLCPITWIDKGPNIISTLAAILAMLDYRQTVMVALSKIFGTMNAETFAKRYGAFPLLVVIIDEFWVMFDEAKTVKTITISSQEGERKIPAGQFFTLAINRFLTTARSLGGIIILTTQRTTREAVTSSIKANSTFVIGSGVPQQLISMCFEQPANQWLGRLNRLMPAGQGLPPRWCFVHGGGPGGRAVFIKLDGSFEFSSDTKYHPDEPPVIDVTLPFYTSSFETVDEVAGFDHHQFLNDIDEAMKRGLFAISGSSEGTPPIPPPVGWLTAMGMAPFPSVDAFLEYGRQQLVIQASKMETRISTDKETGEEE